MAEGLQIFLATVEKVYLIEDDFKELIPEDEIAMVYNDNKNFANKDARYLGAIDFKTAEVLNDTTQAFPFDKNNMTYPIIGETVFIIKNANEFYWLPYTSATQYPNYRKDYKTTYFDADERESSVKTSTTTSEYGSSQNVPNTTQTQTTNNKKTYNVKDKIKFIKPKEGDTILQGRVGNTIRFSESFLVSDTNAKEPSPSIIIRNKQNAELDDKKIGELIEEDINKDGTSIYIVSNNAKVPYNHTTISKEKVAFKQYPTDTDLKGDQLFINSDRVLLSAKANEFIIYGKKNTGIITDGNFSVDAKQDIYLHNEKDITIHSKGSNKIFINSDSGGKIYLGKNTGEGNAGAAVQKMVLGGELVDILSKLIDQIVAMTMASPCGPTSPPTNAAAFNAIKGRLKTILSARNYLSKT